MQLSLNVPINSLSFGQTSVSILREIYKLGLHPSIFPIGPVDLSAQKPDDGFGKWLEVCINSAQQKFSRKNPCIKLWHINGSGDSFSANGNNLITFQESGQLTPTEINILRQQNKIFVTNKYAQSFFRVYGINAEYIPLGFDSHNFHVLEKRPKIDGVTSWLLTSKAEHRKHSYKQLALWAKKYGNKKEHRLNCSITNSFLKPEHQNSLIGQVLDGKQYWNINWLPFSPTNAEYNSVLQSSEIILSCSGSEGYGIPEMQATAMGAWPVAMRAHSYLDFFNDENAVLINPNGMIPIYDSIFFHEGQPFNQGNIYSFDDNDFYQACEEAEKRVKNVGINQNGLLLQKLTYKDTVDALLNSI